MAKSPSPPSLVQQYTVMAPTSEEVLPVPVKLWEAIMDRVRKCADPSQFYDSVGWSCISVAAGAALAAMALPFSADFKTVGPGGNERLNLPAVITEVLFVALTLCGLVLGAVCLRFAKHHRAHSKTMQDWIAEDMRIFKDRHPPSVQQQAQPAAATAPATTHPED